MISQNIITPLIFKEEKKSTKYTIIYVDFMAFDENMTVGKYLKDVFEKRHYNPNLNFQLVFNGKILTDNNKTLKELGITKISELTLMYKETTNKKRTIFKT